MNIQGIVKILASLSGVVSFIAWWRWREIRRKRIPAPQAKSLIRNPDTELSLQRDGDKFRVEWKAISRTAEIYLSDTSGETQEKQLIATIENQNFVILQDIDFTIRYQVDLHLDDGRILSQIERTLPLKSVPNFRDIGGYQTHYGDMIRWNQVYRSSALDNLSVEDSDYLEEIGLKLVCDVRTVEE